MLKQIKGFMGVTVGAILGSHAMGVVGGVSSIPSGIRSVTQIGIGAGVMGYSASLGKKMFKWK